MKDRIIFHVDVNNAFLSWSAVYLLNHDYKKDIRKIPSVIGGDEKKRTGIVLAKSPIAKRYNIITGETLYSARKKCPNIEIFSPLFSWYYKESNLMYSYLKNYTPNIERFSVDECFLDMTGTNLLYKDYLSLAYKIKDDIKEQFGFTVNVGIGNNKLCAKMASDFEKPDKVHTLFKDEITNKMWPLPIEELFMVGKKMSIKLKALNINSIGDLANTPLNTLKINFKNQANFLKNSALGIDNSCVITNNERLSISTSQTLPYDYEDKEKILKILQEQTDQVARQLRNSKKYCKNIAVTYKNNNFVNYTHQKSLYNAINESNEIYEIVKEIFSKSYRNDPLRLIGVRLGDFVTDRNCQISLFEEVKEKNKFQETLDKLQNKFGEKSIFKASKYKK